MGDALFDGGATNLIAVNELRILQLSANLFFDTFDSVFGLKAVRKCRVGFDQMMRAMGTKAAIDLVPNYLRRHKTMYREICAAQENGGAAGQGAAERTIGELSAKVAELQEAVAANTSAVASSAHAVWNMRHTIWEKAPGSFETFAQLKAACYNLQQAKDDPFAYQDGCR